MASVDLSNEEWQQVLNIIAGAAWNVANPLLMKIGDQLRRQQQTNTKQQTNSQEVPVNQGEVVSSRAN